MKKCLVVFVLTVVLVCTVFSYDVSFHAGVFSGAGISADAGKWKVGIDWESSIPFYALGNGAVAVYYDDCSFIKGFELGLDYYRGVDLFAHREIAQIGKRGQIGIAAGVDVFVGLKIPVKKAEIAIKPAVSLKCKTAENRAVFAEINYPLYEIAYAEGFERPLCKIPDYSFVSLITGWKIGFSIQR